jgi:hypothetical protein
MTSLNSAVTAGLGVLAISRLRAKETGFTVWEDAPLPKLPDLYRGIYVREGGPRAVHEQLADTIAAAMTDDRVGVPETSGSEENRQRNSAA